MNMENQQQKEQHFKRKITDSIYSLFASRNDVFARQYLNKDKKAFKLVKQPITPYIIENHLNETDYLGFYQLNEDNKVKWGCLDFDKNTQQDYDKAKELFNFLKKSGYNPLFELSGGGEYKVHIWIFSDLIPSKQMKEFLEHICNEANIFPHEIFPKQESKAEYGNLLKLPLGKHLVTNKLSYICDDNFKPIKDYSEIYEKLEEHLQNKPTIPIIKTKEVQNKTEFKAKNPSNVSKYDSFFEYCINKDLPEGTTNDTKIGSREAGINNNILKNLAIWLYHKGYDLERIEREIKPIYDKKGWAFGDLKGWFKKAEKGDISEISEGEIKIWADQYKPELKDKLKDIPKINKLTPMTLTDFQNYKESKEYLIKDILKPNEISMIYAPSGQYKSIYAMYMALCIASGKKFLGEYRTKKKPVLILSAENSIQTDKKRLFALMKGLKIRSRKTPIYMLPRKDCHDLLSLEYKRELFNLIEEKGIKMLILDTINPLTPEIEDNKAKDVISFFNMFAKRCVDNYNCSVFFLHHTGKNEKNFLGSVKWKAECDNVFRIERRGLQRRFNVYNEKNREGENATLGIDIDFTEKAIELELINMEEAKIFDPKKKMNQEEYFLMKLEELFDDKETKRADIYEGLIKADVKFKMTGGKNSTLERAISKWRKSDE